MIGAPRIGCTSLTIALLVLCLLSHHTILTSVLASATSAPLPGSVLELNDGNFDEALADREVVVNFYAPWCGQCVKFKPIYDEWARTLITDANPLLRAVLVARVDCTLNPETATQHKIQAFPTLKFFRNGIHIADYAGDRSISDLTNWVRTHSRQDLLAKPGAGGGNNNNAAASSTPTTTTAGGAASGTTRQLTPAEIEEDHRQKRAEYAKARQQGSHAGGGGGGGNKKLSLSDISVANLLRMLGVELDLAALESVDMNDPRAVERALSQILDIPRQIISRHPFATIGLVYITAIFQGFFFGILFALRK